MERKRSGLNLRKGKMLPLKLVESYVDVQEVVQGYGWVPVTPSGTLCTWLEADTQEQAWANLMIDTHHIYNSNQRALIERGYEVCEVVRE